MFNIVILISRGNTVLKKTFNKRKLWPANINTKELSNECRLVHREVNLYYPSVLYPILGKLVYIDSSNMPNLYTIIHHLITSSMLDFIYTLKAFTGELNALGNILLSQVTTTSKILTKSAAPFWRLLEISTQRDKNTWNIVFTYRYPINNCVSLK